MNDAQKTRQALKRQYDQAFSNNWDRESISSCHCPEKQYVHVHCPCERCCGKATSRKVEIQHWRNCQHLVAEQNLDFCLEEEDTSSHSSDSHFGDEPDIINPTNIDEVPEPVTIEADAGENLALDHFIVKAVLEALQIMENTKASQKNFEEILNYGKQLFCEGLGEFCDQDVVDCVWPNSWSAAQEILKRVGYEDPKEYFICFCRKKAKRPCQAKEKHVYTGKWDIMSDRKQRCKHCGRKGKVRYYYLGLEAKVKRWCSDSNMCQKMQAHWKEKDHWLTSDPWPIKKEIWDGDRFRELSWFWNPEEQWLLPARCPKSCCCGVVSSDHIEEAVHESNSKGIVELECPDCFTTFCHTPKYAAGDPRNLAYIGHWDGWSPFRSSHKSGAIEVTIANMLKQERCSTNEVYVIGFVPVNKVPNDNPHTLDPFLAPLVKDIKTGFIDGYDVEYVSDVDGLPHGKAKIRHLLLCFTGDYPAICEVGKFLRGGKSSCRRCKVSGVSLEQSNHNQKYYGENRHHCRYFWERRNLDTELPVMMEVQEEERKSKRKKMSSESGYTGVSYLHQLNNLYGFNIIKDCLYDIHHNIPLNVIKNQIDRLIEEQIIDSQEVESNITKIPWTNTFSCGRMPSGFHNRRGFWKAEEYKKFAFPASEVVLGTLLPDDEQEIWTIVARLTEMHFYSGRSGWTDEMIQHSLQLAKRFNILVEEIQGLHMCVVTNHNLMHIPEDLKRFSASDNYWCYPFERAVKKYSSRSSNCKHFEYTFAKAECRRELLKAANTEQKNAQHYVKADNEKVSIN